MQRGDNAEKALKRIAASHYPALGKWESDLIGRATDLASRHVLVLFIVTAIKAERRFHPVAS